MLRFLKRSSILIKDENESISSFWENLKKEMLVMFGDSNGKDKGLCNSISDTIQLNFDTIDDFRKEGRSAKFVAECLIGG